MPGDVGTRLSLGDAPTVAAFRGSPWLWDFGERWSFRVLAAPFSTETEFVADSPVRFEDAVFAAGVPLTQRFEFNSYRFSFFYRFSVVRALVVPRRSDRQGAGREHRTRRRRQVGAP